MVPVNANMAFPKRVELAALAETALQSCFEVAVPVVQYSTEGNWHCLESKCNIGSRPPLASLTQPGAPQPVVHCYSTENLSIL